MNIPTDQHEPIKEKIKGLFEHYRREYPNTKMILITPLSDGGDRIAAHAAMESGVMLAPVLPMKLDKYCETFVGYGSLSKEESIKEFREIINNETKVYSFLELPQKENEEISSYYRYISAYMIANSHIMIALWDGRRYSENFKGGTYDTVRMACEGVDDDLRSIIHPMSAAGCTKTLSPETYLNITEDCLIYHIQVERAIYNGEPKIKEFSDEECPHKHMHSRYIVPEMVSDDALGYATRKGRRFFGMRGSNGDDSGNVKKDEVIGRGSVYEDLPVYYHDIFSRINEMNKDLGLDENHMVTNGSIAFNLCYDHAEDNCWSKVYENLLGDNAIPKIKENGLMYDMGVRQMTTDKLALKFQKKAFNNIEKMIVLSIITATFFQFYILFGGASLIIALYVISLAVAMVFFLRHKKGKYFSKFIEYRLLAESMRVGFYWSLIGINDSTTSASYGYLKNDAEWARAVISAWESPILNDYGALSEHSGEIMDAVGSEWIGSQKNYHKKKKAVNNGKRKRNEMLLLWLKYLLFGASIAAFLLSAIPWGKDVIVVFDESAVHDLILTYPIEVTRLTMLRIGMVILNLVLMSVIIFNNKLLHGGKDSNIDAKYRMFDIAEKRIAIAESTQNFRKDLSDVKLHIYYELGVQAINETNDWAFEHIKKDVDAPDMSGIIIDGNITQK